MKGDSVINSVGSERGLEINPGSSQSDMGFVSGAPLEPASFSSKVEVLQNLSPNFKSPREPETPGGRRT